MFRPLPYMWPEHVVVLAIVVSSPLERDIVQELYKTEVKGINQACDTAKEKVQYTRRSHLYADM